MPDQGEIPARSTQAGGIVPAEVGNEATAPGFDPIAVHPAALQELDPGDRAGHADHVGENSVEQASNSQDSHGLNF